EKSFKAFPPMVAENCAPALLILRRPIVGPRMHFKSSGMFRAAVAENLVRPPAFEIAATPDGHAAHIRKFQCAIDPSAAGPFRRAHNPIPMVIQRDEKDRVDKRAQTERGQQI